MKLRQKIDFFVSGYSQAFIQTVRKIREEYPDKTIMAGNVVTPEMVCPYNIYIFSN